VCQGDPRPGVPLQFFVNKGEGFNRVGELSIPCTRIRDQTVTPLLSSLTGREAFLHVYAGVACGMRLGRSAALALPPAGGHSLWSGNPCTLCQLSSFSYSGEVCARGVWQNVTRRSDGPHASEVLESKDGDMSRPEVRRDSMAHRPVRRRGSLRAALI
jgi:hypothetical protein